MFYLPTTAAMNSCSKRGWSWFLTGSGSIQRLLLITKVTNGAANFLDLSTLPPGLLVPNSGGFLYLNPEMFHQAFIQDVNATEAETLATTWRIVRRSKEFKDRILLKDHTI